MAEIDPFPSFAPWVVAGTRPFHARVAILDVHGGFIAFGYLSSQTSSMRQPLYMLLTMMVSPFT